MTTVVRPHDHLTLRRRAEALLRPAAGLLGYEMVRQSFYSPLPRSEELDRELWEQPNEMRGVELDLEAQFAFLEDQLAPAIRQFEARLATGRERFRLDNGTYESVDAETLFAMVRHAEPRRVVELGSGSSSHVIAMALEEGHPGARHRVFDPHPWTASALGAPAEVEVFAQPATQVAMEEFEALGIGDVLFIDTTHAVRTGGDVTHLFLNVLPRLAPGVLVHVHDIFLPWEYPQHWVVDERRAWAEQYLLQAFLAYNPAFEIVLANHALSRHDPVRLSRNVASFGPGVAPGAFWLCRVD